MRNIHSIFALLILSLWPSLFAKAASETTLVIKTTNGNGVDSVSYSLSKLPAISFTNERIESQSFSKAIKDILSVSFSPVEIPEASSGTVVPVSAIPQGKAYVPKVPEYNQTPIFVPFPMSLNSASFSLSQTQYNYTGNEIRPEVTVSYDETILKKGTDYEVTYLNNINPGIATISFTGKGTYTGTAAISFTIVMPPSFMATIDGQVVEPTLTTVADITMATYTTSTGTVILGNRFAQPGSTVAVWLQPANGYWTTKDSVNVELTDNDVRDLSEMSSYSYTMPESGAVTLDVKFYERTDISKDLVAFDATSYMFEGSPVVPTLTLRHDTVELKEGIDYSISISDNEAPGLAKLTLKGLSRYMGTIDTTFVIKPPIIDLASEDITVSFTDTLYTNNNIPVVPDVVVKHGIDVLEEHVDYEISCRDNAVSGIATMTIKGIGGYTGTIDTTFVIELLTYDLIASKAQLSIDGDMFVYTAQPITPAVVVVIDGQELVEHTDFSVEYNNNTNVGVGKLTVKGQGNYSGTIDTTFVISKAPLTVKAENQTKVYGEENPELTFSITGYLGEDTDSCLTKLPKAVTEATVESPAGEYAITVVGGEAENYEFVYQDAKLVVTKAQLTAKAEDKSKIYGEENPELTATITGFVNGEDATVLTQQLVVATEATAASAVGEYAITVSGAEAENYEFAYEGAKLTVTKAMLAVVADDKQRAYGEENPDLTATITGFVNGEDTTVLTQQPAVATEATAISAVGEYAITVSGAEAQNYDFTYENAKLTVDKAQLTVTVEVQTKVYGEENPELTATITGYVNGEDASAITIMPVVTTDCTTESPVGGYIITVSGGEAQNYEFTYVTGTLTVTSRSLANATLTLTSDSVAYTGQSVLPEFTVQCGSATLIEGTDYDVTPVNNTEPGTATLTVTGKGNYDGQIEMTFIVYLKPSVSVVINGKQITPIVGNVFGNSAPATFESEQGSIMVDNYYALAGSIVGLTVTPKQPYYIFKENISGIDLVDSDPADSTQQRRYRYEVPENGEVAIEAMFLVDSIALGINNYVGALRFEVVDGKTVRVHGARETAPVSVFDARGQQVAAEVVRSDRELIVRLANQPQGLYIIKVNNNTFKVYRK